MWMRSQRHHRKFLEHFKRKKSSLGKCTIVGGRMHLGFETFRQTKANTKENPERGVEGFSKVRIKISLEKTQNLV